jgi:hypothetical protein
MIRSRFEIEQLTLGMTATSRCVALRSMCVRNTVLAVKLRPAKENIPAKQHLRRS